MSASQRRATDSTSVSSTACKSNVERLMTFRASAVAACCCSVSSNSRVFAWSFFASAAADVSLRPARAFVFVATDLVRPPRLKPFAFDSPRLICSRPMDSVGRELESSTSFFARTLAKGAFDCLRGRCPGALDVGLRAKPPKRFKRCDSERCRLLAHSRPPSVAAVRPLSEE
jgi:hypothetical protein